MYKMTQYNSLNVKLSNSQLNKLKSAIKNETEVVLRLSPNMIGDSNDETNFPHKLLLTNRQVLNIRKAFSNNSSVDIKFSNSIIKSDTIRRISWKITRSINKNRITFNNKFNKTIN